jgi:hypothetical protein
MDWEFVILMFVVLGAPKDGRMDAMKSDGAFPPDETAEETAAAANAALVERDGFSVEDLLDLEEFGEPDKDVAENEDTLAPLDAPVAVETEAKTSPGDSQPSSIVTYELPPPPPEMVDLPVSIPFPASLTAQRRRLPRVVAHASSLI